jgi:uncharacterized membrane protein YraQ (UPF0718 family)
MKSITPCRANDMLLIGSILALAVGPFVYSVVRKRDAMLSLLDGFIFVSITGMVLLFILPDSFENGGWFILPVALAGLFGPTVLEGVSRNAAKKTHIAALILGLAGIALHALIDGTALSVGALTEGGVLPLAVVLHRLPVGLTIWWLLTPNFGKKSAIWVLTLIATATIAGYVFGPVLIERLSSHGTALFQALVAGTLLHVVFHQPHLEGSSCGCKAVSSSQNGLGEGFGALLGIGLLAILLFGAGHSHGIEQPGEVDLVKQGLHTIWVLALESAPALLLAYLMAGMLNAFLPYSSIRWLRRGSAPTQALKGMAVGLPFPVCSCGVVPLYQSLIRKGAPATAGMAFLIATPELGLDAVLLSVPLLGTGMTVIRVVAAALVAILVGWLVGTFSERHRGQEQAPEVEAAGSESESTQQSFSGRIRAALHVGLVEVVDHTAPWILLGMGIAAVIQPLLSSNWLARLGDAWEVPLFTLLGLPAYVCASGATPLVAVLLSGGLSPGAALAFLLTGPATNSTTFGILASLHGRKVAMVFSATIITLCVALGYLVNWALPTVGSGALNPAAEQGTSTFHLVSMVLLVGIYFYSILRRGARRFVAELFFKGQRALDLHPHYH